MFRVKYINYLSLCFLIYKTEPIETIPQSYHEDKNLLNSIYIIFKFTYFITYICIYIYSTRFKSLLLIALEYTLQCDITGFIFHLSFIQQILLYHCTSTKLSQ